MNNMQINRIIMNNGNTYEVLWDIGKINRDYYDMIDIKKGWVKISCKYISEEYPIAKLNHQTRINPKLKSHIIHHYGDRIFSE